MRDTKRSHAHADRKTPNDLQQYLLWIDGVGTHLVCLQDRVTIGGPGDAMRQGGQADVALLAGLSHEHASVIRSGDSYLLQAHAASSVADRAVLDRCCLRDGDEIRLGESVRLRFRLPSALSISAKLEFISSHRPSRSIDGIVLMADTCLLGPGRENHVPCPHWSDSVVIFRKNNEISCKSRLDLIVGDRHIRGAWRLNPGDIVTGPDLRFHLETVKPA